MTFWISKTHNSSFFGVDDRLSGHWTAPNIRNGVLVNCFNNVCFFLHRAGKCLQLNWLRKSSLHGKSLHNVAKQHVLQGALADTWQYCPLLRKRGDEKGERANDVGGRVRRECTAAAGNCVQRRTHARTRVRVTHGDGGTRRATVIGLMATEQMTLGNLWASHCSQCPLNSLLVGGRPVACLLKSKFHLLKFVVDKHWRTNC